MMILEPERKSYLLPITRKWWKLTLSFSLSFEQALAYDTDEYYSIIANIQKGDYYEDEYHKYWKNFFNKSYKGRRGRKMIDRRFFMSKISLKSKHFDDKLYLYLTDKLHTVYKTVYTREIRDPKAKKRLFSVGKIALAKYTGIKVYDIPYKLTKEQVSYYYDCMTWDGYDTFKQGESENRRVLANQNGGLSEMQKQQLAEIKKYSTIKKK